MTYIAVMMTTSTAEQNEPKTNGIRRSVKQLWYNFQQSSIDLTVIVVIAAASRVYAIIRSTFRRNVTFRRRSGRSCQCCCRRSSLRSSIFSWSIKRGQPYSCRRSIESTQTRDMVTWLHNRCIYI